MRLPIQSVGINRSMNPRQSTAVTPHHVSPHVMRDPSRRPPIIIKDSCAVICFYTAGRYVCSLVC